MMFKRFVARLLIVLQLHSVLWQSNLHANIIHDYPVRDQIYLHSSRGKDGAMRLALGTDSDEEPQKLLKVFEVPDYSTLSKSNSG